MRRIGQVEAKTRGTFVESFHNQADFHNAKPNLDKLASNMRRHLVYIVIPFDHGHMMQYQVYLMPKGYKFTEEEEKVT